MPKAKSPKIFKVKKEKDVDQFVVRFKNLSKQQVKELKTGLNEYCSAYFQDE